MNPDHGHWPRHRHQILLWAIAGAAACASVAPLEPNMLEEGFIVEIAQRLARGDHLYRDAVTFTGPLPYELLGHAFRIFGESLVWGRLAIVALHGLATASVFMIARRGGVGAGAHFAAAIAASTPILLFPLFSLYFYTTLAFSLALLATWATLRGAESPGWALVGGVLVASVALCKQTVGGILAATLLIALAGCAAPALRVRVIAGFAAGGGAVTALTLVYYGVLGDIGVLYDSLVTLPLGFRSSFDSPYVNFWPPGRFSPVIEGSRMFYLPYFYVLYHGIWKTPGPGIIFVTQLFYALPLLAIAGTLVRRTMGPLSSAAWFNFAALLALMANPFPRADWGHLVFVLPPASIQLVLIVRPSPGEARREGTRMTAAACAIIAMVCLSTVILLYRHSVPPNLGPRVPFRSLSAGMRAGNVPYAVAYLRDRVAPGEEIFVARAEPLLYFATGTRNATPYGGVIPGIREEQQRVIVEALDRIRFVVMNEIDDPLFTYYSEELPLVQEALERRYRIATGYLREHHPPQLLVLERGADRGATALDLIGLRESARAWIRRSPQEIEAAPHYTERLAARLNRRLLAHSVGPAGGGMDFDLRIPPNAVFQADIGYPYAFGLQDIYRLPWMHIIRFRVSLAPAGSDDFVKLLATSPGPVLKHPTKRWRPIEFDLAQYAGQDVTLRLEIVAERPIPKSRNLAWWGSPRIALRSSP